MQIHQSTLKWGGAPLYKINYCLERGDNNG